MRVQSTFSTNVGIKTRAPKFKGYGAVPLHGVILQNSFLGTEYIARALTKLLKGEDINVYIQTDDSFVNSQNLSGRSQLHKQTDKLLHWNQDTYTLRCLPNGKLQILANPTEDDIAGMLAKQMQSQNIPAELKLPEIPLDGGNFWEGYLDDGSPYLIVGQDEIARYVDKRFAEDLEKSTDSSEYRNAFETAKHLCAEERGVPFENLIVLPQPYFHLDLMTRPLAGNTILVQDFEETIKMLDYFLTKRGNEALKPKLAILKAKTIEFQKYLIKEGYHPLAEIVTELEKDKKFNVIKVPGVCSMDGQEMFINYLNGIVHQPLLEKNQLVFVSNKSSYGILDSFFANFVKNEFTKVVKVLFFNPFQHTQKDYMSYMLQKNRGGLHCLVAEWPMLDTVGSLRRTA